VQEPGDSTERARLDCIDERAHPLSPRGGEIHVLRRTAAAFRNVGCRTALARVDDLAGEQRIAGRLKCPRFGAREELASQALVEMRLRPVEIDPRDFEAEAAKAAGLGGEQLIEPFDLWLLHCRRT
jgi:hypothetical protein